jgi:5-methyltetrahydrofolate--homocysteine methyltransferase
MSQEELIEAITSIREEEAVDLAVELLDSGLDPFEVVKVCKEAVQIVGDRFETGEVFIPELIMAGEIMTRISAEVKPRLKKDDSGPSRGRVLIGTVEGDLHDIGKDIVVFLLDVNGFEVIDLGIDVPPSTFVEKIRETQPSVVGLSGLLSLAFNSMKATVQAIEEAGLRKEVKIMIGGGAVDETIREYAGADAWGENAGTAVTLAQKWIEGEIQ